MMKLVISTLIDIAYIVTDLGPCNTPAVSLETRLGSATTGDPVRH